MKLSSNKIILSVAILVAAGVAFFSFYPSANNAAAKNAGGPPPGFSMKVEAVPAEQKSISEEIKLVGNLLANESVTLSAEVMGRVASIPFKEGSQVGAGALLFKLDDSVQLGNLAQAKANLELTQSNVERYTELVKTGAISKMKLQEAEAQLRAAQANVQLAYANLSKTNIRAPFSGQVGIRQVSVGDVVTPGQKLLSMEQVNPMRVQFSVPERYLGSLVAKGKLDFTTDSVPGKVFEAEITAIDPKIDMNTRSVSVQAVANNKDRLLFSGQFVSITLPLQKAEGNIVIPDQALIPLGDKYFVFKVVNGAAQKAEVKVGIRKNSEAEIIAGINPGEMIVTAGHQKLQDHVPVRVAAPTPVVVSKQAQEKE